MSDADKALFRGAYDRPLATLVPAQANNPPVGAYPTFIRGAAPGTMKLVVLRRRVADVVDAVVVGTNRSPLPNRASVDIDETSEIPLTFQRGRTLNRQQPSAAPSSPTASVAATDVDPAADPAAVVLNALWVSIPTFVMGRVRLGTLQWPTMQYITLRRTAPAGKVVSFGVPIPSVGLHPQDGTGSLRASDLTDPSRVPLVMRAAQAYAEAHGYAAGVPGFAESTQALVQLMLIKDAEVVEPTAVAIGGVPRWRCSDLPLNFVDPWPENIFPDIRHHDLAGGHGSDARIVHISGGRALDYDDFPRPPDYAPIAVNTGGIQSIDIGPADRYHPVATADTGTMTHALYISGGVITHATRRLAGAADWVTEVVDGDGVGTHVSDPMGWSLAITVRPGTTELHAFYPTSARVLRHAELIGTTWVTEDLDGHTSDNAGRVTAMMDEPSAVIEPDGRVHVFYYDQDSKNLRHAERRNGTWSFEVLDGAGSETPPPDGSGTGPIRGLVGQHSAASLFDGRLYVFYDDENNENIRMAVRRVVGGAERWSFAPFAGHRGGPGAGHFCAAPATAIWRDRLSVLYFNARRLGHASVEPGWGMPWRHEIVDGEGGADGRISGWVGVFARAVAVGGTSANPDLPLAVAHLDGEQLTYRWAVLADPP